MRLYGGRAGLRNRQHDLCLGKQGPLDRPAHRRGAPNLLSLHYLQ